MPITPNIPINKLPNLLVVLTLKLTTINATLAIKNIIIRTKIDARS